MSIDRHAEVQLDGATARANQAIVYARCLDSEIRPNCGYILRHTATDDFRAKFRERVCAAKDAEQCEIAFQRMIDAQLAQRYFAADWNAVGTDCDLSPPKCDDPIVFEQMLLHSHNTNVVSKFDAEAARVEADRRRKHAEQAERGRRALGELAYLLHDGPKCRSYPSAFGNMTNTVCTK